MPATSKRIGFAQHFLERRDVPMRRPQLQFRVAVRAQAGQIVVAAREEIDARERLRVAAIQALGQPDHRRQHPHGLPQRPVRRSPYPSCDFFGVA